MANWLKFDTQHLTIYSTDLLQIKIYNKMLVTLTGWLVTGHKKLR